MRTRSQPAVPRGSRHDQAPPDLRVGDWTLQYRLGEGGMGVVHLARDAGGRRVALKVLRPHVVGDEEARDRLAREVHSLERVRSPYVAEIVDSDPWGPVPYVAMRYVPGPALHDHVAEEGPLRGADLVHFAARLAEALQAVHAVGVVHRDVKPSNVVMEGRTPILIDFGLARLADDTRITRTGFLLGTPGYLAPEVLFGHEPGPAADVHSWAATVAFAGTGRAPYGSGPSMAVMDRVRRGEHDVAGLDPAVRHLVERALDPEPRARPGLAEVLRQLAGPPPAAAAPTQQVELPEAAPVTRFLFDDVDLRMPESEWPTPPRKVSLAERSRRWSLGLALLAVVALALVAAPYPVAGGLAVIVALLRFGSVVRSSALARRQQRGSRWYDAPQTVVLTPFDLLVSIPGTSLLLGTSAVLVVSAALISTVAGFPTAQWMPGAAALGALVLWVGPTSRRVRGAVSALGRPLAHRIPVWLLTLAVLAAFVGVLVAQVNGAGTTWAPGNGAPWRAGTWWGDHLPG